MQNDLSIFSGDKGADSSKILLSDVPGENTRRYLAYIIEKCGIQRNNINTVHNLACGSAEESRFLEELFVNAQITGIDKNSASISWARDISQKCTRTTLIEGDLDKQETWERLPKADIILLQQPQLSGFENRAYIEEWIPKISKTLSLNGIFIVCLMCPADHNGFYESDILEGAKSPAEICDMFFEKILDEESPHGNLGNFYYILAFRKKSKKVSASAKVKRILE